VELKTVQVTKSPVRLTSRLQFIDFARGVVMMIMAWDHVSGFWNQIHGGLEGIYPYRNPALDLTWFLARFVSHVCAPTFVFLAGVSMALSVNKRLSQGSSQGEISTHLIKRGLLLLLFEALLVAPAFDLPYLYFGVIAAIGVGLIVFSVCRRLPTAAILAISMIVILNHQWLSLGFIPMDVGWGHYLRRVLHEPGFTWPPYFALYPIIPWIGVMGLGWVFGTYLHGLDRERIFKLKAPLVATGVASMLLFFLVRWANGYGNLVRRWSGDVMDWLYISKYPPSIAFLLWSLGGMCLILALGLFIEERGWSDNSISGVVHAFGRTPLFFYLTHLWLYRLRLPRVPAPFYLDLWQTLGFWAVGLVVLWVLCSRYEKIKRRHPRFLQYI
jgi:uncharacterized membrane protein